MTDTGREIPLRVLLVDPNIVSSSPTMKGIVWSIPYLQEQGMEIEAWCWCCERDLKDVTVRLLPRLPVPRQLSLWAFFFVCNFYGLYRFGLCRKPRPDVIQSGGFYYLGADMSVIQFSNIDWLRAQLRLGFKGVKDLLIFARTLLGVVADLILMWNPGCRRLHPASDAVAADLRRWGPAWNRIEVLPNAFDPEKFTVERRERERAGARKALGFRGEDLVFAFVSLGHYRRKGFFEAVEILENLRTRGHHSVRFLVVGGTEATLSGLKKKLECGTPGWESWITFTGMVDDTGRILSAADAFLYPSYSEAFALVEIEASALGLPLYLTRHHGAEMILEDGINGRFIDWDPSKAADVIEEELREGRVVPGESQTGRAVSREEYARRLAGFLESAAADRRSVSDA